MSSGAVIVNESSQVISAPLTPALKATKAERLQKSVYVFFMTQTLVNQKRKKTTRGIFPK
jgi:hypothetical protein